MPSFARSVVDVLQIPAFLCRQTDLLLAAGKTGKVINIKKGQFCAASVMRNSADKIRSAGNPNVIVCERGTMFGYTDLVVDPRNVVWMRDAKCPVVRPLFVQCPVCPPVHRYAHVVCSTHDDPLAIMTDGGHNARTPAASRARHRGRRCGQRRASRSHSMRGPCSRGRWDRRHFHGARPCEVLKRDHVRLSSPPAEPSFLCAGSARRPQQLACGRADAVAPAPLQAAAGGAHQYWARHKGKDHLRLGPVTCRR